MHQKTTEIQKRYDGFLRTPSLWKGNTVMRLQQFDIQQESLKINFQIDEKLRLGKYIERFVSYQLNQIQDISILSENVQIQQNKRTLGELDCILKKGNTIIHLEVIYKFYLYDSSVGNSEIEHCIGPNRKDSLQEKLNKLKEKQLPILYTDECKTYLESIHLKASIMEQQVYFKAQLFVPFKNQNIAFSTLNSKCIQGFYCSPKELKTFVECKFYIPTKKDWLIQPHQNVNWHNYNQFEKEAADYLTRKFSTLCWIKKPNGEILKFFLVWWN